MSKIDKSKMNFAINTDTIRPRWMCAAYVSLFSFLALAASSFAEERKTDPALCEKCGHESKIRKKIQPDRLQHFLNPIPLGVSSEAIGIDLDSLWSSLRAGLSVGEIATKNDSAPKSVIDALASSNRAQVDFLTCGEEYSEDEVQALYMRADGISSEFVLNPFDLKNADWHIELAATDWGDPESAVACMQGNAGGRLLDLKYRLDVYDDIRGGQHNFIPSEMNACEIRQVLSFGEQNRQALLDVADDVIECGAPNYSNWLISIATGTFAEKVRGASQ